MPENKQETMALSSVPNLAMTAAHAKRCWLRFSIRTLLIAVTISCVWLAWQVSIVRERLAMRQKIENAGGRRHNGTLVVEHTPYDEPAIPYVRRAIGDQPVTFLELPTTITATERLQIQQAFPEAKRVLDIKIPAFRLTP